MARVKDFVAGVVVVEKTIASDVDSLPRGIIRISTGASVNAAPVGDGEKQEILRETNCGSLPVCLGLNKRDQGT